MEPLRAPPPSPIVLGGERWPSPRSMPCEKVSVQPAGGRALPKVCISSLEKVGRALLGLQTAGP